MASSMNGAASCMPLMLNNFDICLITVLAGLETEMCIFRGIFCASLYFVSHSKMEGTNDACPCMIAER
jgi:hypothetical protein